MCNDYTDCNSKGYCVANDCLCDAAWFDSTCENNLDNFSPKGFVAYRVVFLMIYSLIAIISFVKLYFKTQKEKHFIALNNCLFILKTMRSPYNLTMLLINAIAITRIIWMAVDPFGYNDIFHRSVERLFFETTYSFLFMIYAIVLWVWYSIYQEISAKNKNNTKKKGLKCFQIQLRIFILLIVIVQITTSILKGFYNQEFRWITLVLYVGLFFIFVTVTIEYGVFGWLLYKCIIEREKTVKTQIENLIGQTGAAVEAIDKSLKAEDSLRNTENRKNPSYALEAEEPSPTKEAKNFENKEEKEETKNIDNNKKVFFSSQLSIKGSEQIAHQDAESLEITANFAKYEKHESLHLRSELNDQTDKNSSPRNNNEEEKAFDIKVKEIVEKHRIYLKPVELVDAAQEEFITEASVILDKSGDAVWDFINDYEMKLHEEKRKKRAKTKHETKIIVENMRKKSIVRTILRHDTSRYQIENLYKAKLLNDKTYLENHQKITEHDKIIIKKIFSLTVIAICLEVIFIVMTLLIFGTPVLQSPTGMIAAMWFTGFIEICAIVAIICLFSIVETQQNENLRLLTRIGQNKNRINKLYGFVLPDFLRREDSKKSLEKSINLLTARYMKNKNSNAE